MIDTLASWKDAAPAAAAITAAVSAFVALFVFAHTRNANRRRATLDMVMKTLLDSHSQARYGDYKELIRKDKDPNNEFNLASLVVATSKNHADRETILTQLNIYEMTALGIRRRLFEEAFYKRWFHNQFMTDYESSRDFIETARSTKGSIYCEFTCLYERWNKSGHPLSSTGPFRMAWWALTKQHGKLDKARDSMRAR